MRRRPEIAISPLRRCVFRSLPAWRSWRTSRTGLMKHITNYQQTKPVYDGMKTAKDKTAYRRAHESDIILHEAAARALRKHAGNGGKLPNFAKLQADYAKLTENKNALRAEYGKLKRQAKEYGIVKKNVDSILDPGTEQRAQGKEKRRNVEL